MKEKTPDMSFTNLPHIISTTFCIIAIITTFIILEKLLRSKLKGWGEIYPALLFFTIVASKTFLPLIFLWKLYGLKPDALGWFRWKNIQVYEKGILLGAIIIGFTVIYQKYSILLFGKPYISSGEHFLKQESNGIVLTITISAALLNALGEEIIFRGMLLPVLLPYLGIIPALILQAAIFSIYHLLPLQNSLFLFFMGIIFGLGYIWSGVLLSPVLAHLLENCIPILIFLLSRVIY